MRKIPIEDLVQKILAPNRNDLAKIFSNLILFVKNTLRYLRINSHIIAVTRDSYNILIVNTNCQFSDVN